MDRDGNVNVEAFLQQRGSQDLVNPIALDLRELIKTPARGQRPDRRKRKPSSTGSSSEKPPRKETGIATGIVSAEIERLEHSQEDPNNNKM